MSDDPQVERLYKLLNVDKQTGIFQYENISAVRELASFVLANNNATFNAFDFLEFFLKILKCQQTQISSKKSNADIYIEAAENYIRLNLQNPIRVSEITDFLGVSQPYLHKIFKERFFQSPKQYILNHKIAYAQILLKTTDISITDIARSLGFPDVMSFSKCFKLRCGISAQNYREKENNGLL